MLIPIQLISAYKDLHSVEKCKKRKKQEKEKKHPQSI